VAAGVLSDAAPTGVAVWDAVLRAAVAFGLAYLGVRARPIALLLGGTLALAAAAAAGSSDAAAFAAPAAGMAVAVGATVKRRAPVAGAVVAGLVALACLHLGSFGFHGASAIVGIAVPVPVAISGWRHQRSERKQRNARLLAGVAALGALATIGGIVGMVLAARPVQHAIVDARAGLDSAREGDTTTASAQFGTAAADFATARDRLEEPWAVLGRLVPVQSQHIAAMHDAASAGYEVAISGARSVGLVRLEQLTVTDGAIDVAQVASLEQPLGDARRSLAHAERALKRSASPWLLAPAQKALARELDRVETARDDADLALHIARVLPKLLGADGQRRYFLAIQQPAELRGSGGIIGNFGELAADAGRLDVVRFGTDGDLNAAAEANNASLEGAPADYQRRFARFNPDLFWQNVTASIDFPTVAEVVGVLYPQSGGTQIDGVVSVDPSALAALLSITGPVAVDPWPAPLTAANVEQVLYVDQYVRFPAGSETERKRFLGDVAEAVTDRLTTGQLPRPDRLIDILGPAVRGRHLVFASFDGEEQRLFDRIGASGRARPTAPDVLAVVNQNAGGNKLDTFLRRAYRYEVGERTRAATLTLQLRNDAPDGLGVLAAGNYQGDPLGTNRTYVSVHTTRRLRAATLDGQPLTMESETEFDANVFSAFLVIPRGGARELVLQLEPLEPHGAHYELLILHQPLVEPDEITVRAPGASFSGALDEDMVISTRR